MGNSAGRKLSQDVVDMTFNAWWQVFGNKPKSIDRALKKTRDQIGPPMPHGYVPPPRRRTSATKKKRKHQPAPKDFKHYIKLAPQGINRLRMDLKAAHKWPYFPKPLRDKLMKLPCYASPDKQWAAEQKVINAYYAQVGDGRYHGPIMAGNGKIYASEEAYRREVWLSDLKFMTQSTVGAGVYGAERAAGMEHERAMKHARVAQAAFDLAASGKADPAAKKDEIRGYTTPPSIRSRTDTQGVARPVRK